MVLFLLSYSHLSFHYNWIIHNIIVLLDLLKAWYHFYDKQDT